MVKVKDKGVSQQRSQKAICLAAQRFSTRSGKPLSTRSVTWPFQ